MSIKSWCSCVWTNCVELSHGKRHGSLPAGLLPGIDPSDFNRRRVPGPEFSPTGDGIDMGAPSSERILRLVPRPTCFWGEATNALGLCRPLSCGSHSLRVGESYTSKVTPARGVWKHDTYLAPAILHLLHVQSGRCHMFSSVPQVSRTTRRPLCLLEYFHRNKFSDSSENTETLFSMVWKVFPDWGWNPPPPLFPWFPRKTSDFFSPDPCDRWEP